MNLRKLTVRCQPDGSTVLYLQTEDGDRERIRIGSTHGDHDIIRYGEFVAEDWDPDARLAAIEARERREAADGD